tara:strand:+ start:842 stop:1627 length:786 start_codon:yes stop_codon:yes gene_type:complete
MNFLKKSLGQNFLIDKNIIKKIVNLTEIKNKNVIEIGPGKGALTDEILKKKPKSLIIIEKDDKFVKELRQKYNLNRVVKIFNSDVLKINIQKIIKENTTIFGNLPYNISSQILVKFLRLKNTPFKFKNIIFMFQKELGKKISGKHLTSDYSRLSILTKYKFKIFNNFLVSSNCFFPRPKIDSMVIHFKAIKQDKYLIKDITSLEKVTNILFSNKRKMINKNITKILKSDQIKKMKNLNLKSRPSDLKPDTYYKITELFEEK